MLQEKDLNTEFRPNCPVNHVSHWVSLGAVQRRNLVLIGSSRLMLKATPTPSSTGLQGRQRLVVSHPQLSSTMFPFIWTNPCELCFLNSSSLQGSSFLNIIIIIHFCDDAAFTHLGSWVDRQATVLIISAFELWTSAEQSSSSSLSPAPVPLASNHNFISHSPFAVFSLNPIW